MRFARCPRFASFFRTPTWAEEDAGGATVRFYLTVSRRPLRFNFDFNYTHPFAKDAKGWGTQILVSVGTAGPSTTFGYASLRSG